jgi:hypothetical protein
MILLGKFSETIGVGDSLKDNFDKSKQCVAIADDYAIDFAVWCDLNATQKSKGFWYSIPLQIPLWEAKTTKELLEIFKKEKGL